MNRNRRLLIIILGVLYFSLHFESPVQSQDSSEFAVEGVFYHTTQFYWSSDSRQFAFYNWELGAHSGDFTVETNNAGWQVIDIPTASISSGSNLWPLQPSLTAGEEELMNPYEFIYQSPDGNLLFFAQNNRLISQIGAFYPLYLFNRSTGQLAAVSLGIDYLMPSSTNVMWSEDSHGLAFTTMDFSGTLRIWHLAIPDFENLGNHTLQRFELMIHNVLYGTTVVLEDELLDISPDGQTVLLAGRDLAVDEETRSFYDSPAELIIWHPATASADIVTADVTVQTFMQAKFTQNDDTKLWIKNYQGLFRYDLLSNETSLIRNDFDTNSLPLLSPDGAWLCLVGNDEIRFIPMPELE